MWTQDCTGFSICGLHPLLCSPHWGRPPKILTPIGPCPYSQTWSTSSVESELHWQKTEVTCIFSTMLWDKVEKFPLLDWNIIVLLGKYIQLLWSIFLWPVYMTNTRFSSKRNRKLCKVDQKVKGSTECIPEHTSLLGQCSQGGVTATAESEPG